MLGLSSRPVDKAEQVTSWQEVSMLILQDFVAQPRTEHSVGRLEQTASIQPPLLKMR